MDLSSRGQDHDLHAVVNGIAEGLAWNLLIRDARGDVIDYQVLLINNAFLTTADYDHSLDPVGSRASALYGMDSSFVRSFYEGHRGAHSTATTEYQSPRSGRWYRVSTSPFVDDRFVTTFSDITQAVEARLKREHSIQSEAVGALAGILAHDFRNALGTLDAQLTLLKAEISQGEVKPRLERIQAIMVKAHAMTHRLATLSHEEVLATRAQPFKPILMDAVALVVEGTQVVVVDEVAEALWRCNLDEELWARAIDNLTRNAVEAMEGAGRLVLRAWNHQWTLGDPILLTARRFIRFDMIDSGPGISAEVIPRVFDANFTTKQTGQGLGLASVFAVVRRHSGLITVRSEPGTGTTFSLWIPAEG